MNRLLHLCAMLIGLFGLGAALSQLSTRGQPDPLATMFTTTDGQPCVNPCLFGIEPGLTTYQEASLILTMHPLTSHLVRVNTTTPDLITMAGQGIVITLHVNPDQTISEALVFFVDDAEDLPATNLSKLYLGEVQLYLHLPTRVSIARDPLRTINNPHVFASWYYDSSRFLLTARLVDQHMNATTPLKHIQLSADQDTLGQFSPVNFAARIMVSYTTTRWLGFTSLAEYMSAALKEAGVRQLLY